MVEQRRLSNRRRAETFDSEVAALDLEAVDRVTGGRLGTFDVACPMCAPAWRRPASQRKRVLRIWRHEPSFASFHCARCGERGYVRDDFARPPDPARLAKVKAQAAARDQDHAEQQRRKALAMWRMSVPAAGTIVETYLKSRGITVSVPATARFLRPHKSGHHPAMIVPFGIPEEPEPGILDITESKVIAAHLTLLKADGSGKADIEPNKITIGSPAGMPLVLAPMNDLMGLAITEGIEDTLSVHQASGYGAWATGSAPFMPKLTRAIEDLATMREYDASPDCITIFADADDTGQHNAHALAAGLAKLSAKLAAPPKTEHFEVLIREATR
jgi:hypothetical protein